MLFSTEGLRSAEDVDMKQIYEYIEKNLYTMLDQEGELTEEAEAYIIPIIDRIIQRNGRHETTNYADDLASWYINNYDNKHRRMLWNVVGKVGSMMNVMSADPNAVPLDSESDTDSDSD